MGGPALYGDGYALVSGERLQASGHPSGSGRHVDGPLLARERALVELRKREHVVDKAAHRLRLVVDKAGELLPVLRQHHIVLHKLGVARYHLQRRLHLVADVAGEIAAHAFGFGKLLVLLLELRLLIVDALKKGHHFPVDVVFQRFRHVKGVDRLHDVAREQPGQQEYQSGDDHEREQRWHEHLAQEGEQGMTGFRQADDAPIGELLGGIHRIGAQGFRIAHAHRLARARGLADLGTGGVVIHLTGVCLAIVEHQAVFADKRVAGDTAELLGQDGGHIGGRGLVKGRRRPAGFLDQGLLGIMLIGVIKDADHHRGKGQKNPQGKRQNGGEDAAGKAFNVIGRRAHAANLYSGCLML